jgi:dolichol-phosphate mannosyltransferase
MAAPLAARASARGAAPAAAIELSVVIPVLNEAENVPLLLERLTRALQTLPLRFEIILVDDGSTDGTRQVAESLQGRYPQLRVVPRAEQPAGLAPSVVAGWQRARGDLLAVMDADLQHPPEVLARMVETVRAQDADVVIASRYTGTGERLRWHWLRARLSRGAAHLAQSVLPPAAQAVTDPMSGCFVLRRRVILGLELKPRGYKILLEVLSRGRYDRLLEVPYVFGRRHKGRSKLSPYVMRDYVVQLWHLIWTPHGLGRFLRYCLVGSSGVGVNMGLLWLLREWERLAVMPAAVVAVEGAILNNFLWNELWTFQDRSRLRPRLRHRLNRFAHFNVICGAGAGIHLAVFWLLTAPGRWHYLLANLVAIGIVTVWNYGLNLSWTWTRLPERT